ncbi:DUF2057 family protein [Vibrio sp. HN007]|uniref:DUF2057 family protein n=1 Tax=Vibrio iocasae TaxID=3098914 RepID=UPI0035D4D46E
MKITKPLLLSALISVSCSVYADVNLQFDGSIDLYVVNGQKADSKGGGLFSSTKAVTLPDGENQIAFKYSYYFDKKDEREVLESDVIIAKFNASNAELTIDIDKAKNQKQAKQYLAEKRWALVDTKLNQAVPVAQDTLHFEGFQLSRNFQTEVSEYNKAGGPAAITRHKEIVAIVPEMEAQEGQFKNKEESMLHFWYEQADEETKTKFKEFINNQ